MATAPTAGDVQIELSELLRWFAARLVLDGYRALPCERCARVGNMGVHNLHWALSEAATRLDTQKGQ